MAKIKDKHGQEEIVGFAMIIIIVAVIVLILLGIALNKPQTNAVESYEIESFIQASLQHTTDCSSDFELSYADVNSLITECDNEQVCSDERPACEVLETTLKDILESSWKTGQDRPVKGYVMNITSDNMEILSLGSGNVTSNYKGSVQDLSRRGSLYSIEFRAYY